MVHGIYAHAIGEVAIWLVEVVVLGKRPNLLNEEQNPQ